MTNKFNPLGQALRGLTAKRERSGADLIPPCSNKFCAGILLRGIVPARALSDPPSVWVRKMLAIPIGKEMQAL
jgi:hypothetical protein